MHAIKGPVNDTLCQINMDCFHTTGVYCLPIKARLCSCVNLDVSGQKIALINDV